MIKIMALILCLGMLTGCGAKNDSMDRAAGLRKQLLEAAGCSFQTVIHADYGDTLYTFQMECTSAQTGEVKFTVTDPKTISGVSGTVSGKKAGLVFDDTVLAFPVLAEGELTPVVAPWIFFNTLKSGYLKACDETDTGFCLYIDDSFEENPLHLQIYTDLDLQPEYAEIIWHERRILSLDIRNFVIV